MVNIRKVQSHELLKKNPLVLDHRPLVRAIKQPELYVVLTLLIPNLTSHVHLNVLYC